MEDLTEAVQGNRLRGRGPGHRLGAGRDRQLLPRFHCYEDGEYEGFCDPWEDEIIQEGTEEWRKADQLIDSVTASWPTGWNRTCRARFAELLNFILPRLPDLEQLQEKEESDDDDR